MKILFILLTVFSLAANTFAQIPELDFSLFGVERLQGSYTGVSNIVSDDTYRLQNMATWNMEFVGPKKNYLIGLSWPTMKILNLKNGWLNASTFTDKRFHPIQNRSVLKFCSFTLLGDPASKKLRYGFGYQAEIRQFGIYTKNMVVTGYNSGVLLAPGALQRRGRLFFGPGFHLADSFGKFLYTRFSLFADYSPGKMQAVSIHPEGLAIAYYKILGVFVRVSFRYDYMWGSQLGADEALPLTSKFTNHTVLTGEAGLAIHLN